MIGSGPAANKHHLRAAAQGCLRRACTWFSLAVGWSDLAKDLQELWLARGQRVRVHASRARIADALRRSRSNTISIACADSPSPGPLQFPHLARQELRQNGPIGLVPLWGDEPCSTWPVHSAAGYFGPWNTRTAAPILVIGNTTDPATPLKNSVEMAAELARARLLVVRGYGHTACLQPQQMREQRRGRLLRARRPTVTRNRLRTRFPPVPGQVTGGTHGQEFREREDSGGAVPGGGTPAPVTATGMTPPA